MKLLALLVCSVFSVQAVYAQSGESIIDWLATLQAAEARLRPNGSRGNTAAELRSLHREITAWASGRSDLAVGFPEFPAGDPNRQELVDYVASLRKFLEEAERRRPGGAFQAGRIEVNVTASALQVPTASTLDESEYRMRNLPKTADALNLV